MKTMTWIRRGVVLGVLVLLSGCVTVPETGRRAFHMFDDAQLATMAQAQFSQMKQEGKVSQNAAHNQRVTQVGRRIAAAVGQDIPNANWEFVVFEDDATVNAFAMPGGKVAVYTGLLKLATTDDELAAVMGHEVAHVRCGHGNERMSQGMAAELVGMGVDYASRKQSDSTRQMIAVAYGLGSQLGLLLPYSRLHETEADEVGLLYAARAGYDPRAAVTFWQKMQRQGGGQPPEFLSTHPSHEGRIRHMQELMPKALAEYQRVTGKPPP